MRKESYIKIKTRKNKPRLKYKLINILIKLNILIKHA